jgi:hypothetical protein
MSEHEQPDPFEALDLLIDTSEQYNYSYVTMTVPLAKEILSKYVSLEEENEIRKAWLDEVSGVNLKWAKEIARFKAGKERK